MVTGQGKRSVFIWIPVTFLLHMIEEYFFGFPEWASSHFGPITTRSFYVTSHIPIFAVVIYFGFKASKADPRTPFIWLALVAQVVLLTNGLFHCMTTILFQEYSPGIVTSILCYFPFSIILYRWIFRERMLSTAQLLSAAFVGTAVSLLVVYSLTWN